MALLVMNLPADLWVRKKEREEILKREGSVKQNIKEKIFIP